MRRVRIKIVMAVVAVLFLIGLASCSTYRSSYFTRSDDRPQFIDHFQFSPRMFGYRQLAASKLETGGKMFSVTVRVEDSSDGLSVDGWRQDGKQLDSLADEFLRQLTDAFVIDSLVLHETPTTRERLALLPDSTNYSPRRENFLTLRFGQIDFPRETIRVCAVLHVTRPGLPPSADSAVFQLWRVELEEKGLLMFKDKTQGY